jgi:hypothetical protein
MYLVQAYYVLSETRQLEDKTSRHLCYKYTAVVVNVEQLDPRHKNVELEEVLPRYSPNYY